MGSYGKNFPTVANHKIDAFWAENNQTGTGNRGYGWRCECGTRSAVNFGTREAAHRAGENIHLARFQSEEEIQAKREEEHRRIKARSKEILDRFI